MAETSNIANMARRASQEIFEVFGWRQVGPLDENWECSEPETHRKKTHPSDVVFFYDDPYTQYRVYVNTDLKSYGAGTIDRPSLSGALQSLTLAVECANSSESWRSKYDDGSHLSEVIGMLFVYNHDKAFKDANGEFLQMLRTVDPKALTGVSRRRLVVLGPADISFLFTVAHDIEVLRGKGRIPLANSAACNFWYPDLVQAKPREQAFPAATVEMLTGPWIVMRVEPSRYFLWYRRNGTCVDEFRYLLEYIFSYQLLSHKDSSVVIRLVESGQEAMTLFDTAKEQFDAHHHRLASERLTAITCEPVTAVESNFSTTPIGWTKR